MLPSIAAVLCAASPCESRLRCGGCACLGGGAIRWFQGCKSACGGSESGFESDIRLGLRGFVIGGIRVFGGDSSCGSGTGVEACMSHAVSGGEAARLLHLRRVGPW